MAIGQNFYGQGDEINNLFRSQANQSINAGYNAADLADPFRNERKGYQNSLRSLMANPGEFSSSPVYKFAYDQGLNALQRKGSVRSGNKLAELMKYGQNAASQLYFPQANLLSNLAMSGSNPGVASAAVSGAFNRSQDQRQMGKAAEMYSGGNNSRARSPLDDPFFSAPASTVPFSQLPSAPGAASGGYGYMPSGGYSPSYSYGSGGYVPTTGAGTGYMTSDYGTTNFGNMSFPTTYDNGPYWGAPNSDIGGYGTGFDSFGDYSDYGLPGYSDYGDYGWDE